MDKKELWRRTFKHAMEDVLDKLKLVLIGMLFMVSFLGCLLLMNYYPFQTVIGIIIIGIIVFNYI